MAREACVCRSKREPNVKAGKVFGAGPVQISRATLGSSFRFEPMSHVLVLSDQKTLRRRVGRFSGFGPENLVNQIFERSL